MSVFVKRILSLKTFVKNYITPTTLYLRVPVENATFLNTLCFLHNRGNEANLLPMQISYLKMKSKTEDTCSCV